MPYIAKNGRKYGGKLLMSPECYSTEEKEIGCWTDGKPLYQRTFKVTSPSPTTVGSYSAYQVAEVTGNYDIAMFVNGVVKDTTGQRNYALSYDRYYSSTDKFIPEVYVDSSTHTLIAYATCPTASNFIASEISMTVQYTKTTDVAGSGTWTPSGVPAVHYSTNEQVVGTWIDGSTLYERTYSFHAASTWSSNVITLGSYDTSWEVKDIQSFADENGTFYEMPYVAGSANMHIQLDTNGNILLVIYNTSFAAGTDLYVTIKYTKTTS